MKKKLLTCLTLLLCICSGAWADPVTIGLTQDYSAASDTEEGTKTWSSLTEATDHLTLTQQIGSQILNYEHTSTGKGAAYIDGTGHGKGLHCWRVGDPGTAYDNQYVGYDLTISSGYILNISAIKARALYLSTALVWKLQILSSTDEVLYESAEMTMSKTANPSPMVDVTVANLSSDAQAKLQGVSGSVKVRLWVKGGKTKYFGIDQLTITGDVAEDTRPSYTITANVATGQESYGSIDKAGDNVIAEGESLVLTATANSGYAFINWTNENDEEVSTNATLTLTNVQSNASYTANFQSVYQVAWDSNYRGTYGKIGTGYSVQNGVNEKWADANNKFTIPTYSHKFYYREGYRFSKWAIVGDASSNRYNSGDEITVTDGTINNNKVTLKPVFVKTNAKLSSSAAPTEVTWSFAKSNMVFVDWQSNDKYEYFTTTATVNGEQIDIPMKVTKGKVANYTRTDNLAQTNQNTQFTIPAIKGMVVTIANAYKEFSTTTIGGSTNYTKSDNDKTITYTYTGDASEIDIIIGESGQYLSTIVVTYPQITRTVTIASSGWSSYSSDLPLDFANATDSEDGKTLKAYALSSLTKSTATLTSVENAPASTGLILKGKANETYTIPVCAAPAEVGTNKLVACIAAATVDANSVYVVSGGGLKLFTGTDIPANKAYMPKTEVDNAAEAKVISFVFDGETTGISTLDNFTTSPFDNDAPMYNLAGQRVGKNYKGVVIQNGKKIIIK